MSGYPVPFLSEDRGCFCCAPTVPSSPYVNQFHNLGNGSKLLQNELHHVPSNYQECNLLPLVQNVHLQDNFFSQQGHLGSPTTQREDFMMFIPSTSKGEESLSQNSSVNFRMLQSRQIGGKLDSSVYNTNYSVLSSSAPVSSISLNTDYFNSMEENTLAVNCHSDSMDLDSALDELGMLSTITNSRKQYLIETRGHTSSQIREKRLRCKSESSPNLTALGKPNGFQIIQLDTNYVIGVTDFVPASDARSGLGMDYQPQKSLPTRLEYRNPDILEESVRRRRSIPRMSKMRKDKYRRSRCPYKIPNRLYHSMQESDFGSDVFETGTTSFVSSSLASTSDSEASSSKLTDSRSFVQSKSNTTSPVKPSQEFRLVKSLSAEDLTQVQRRFEQELNDQMREKSKTEQSLDLMTCQMTNLHMT